METFRIILLLTVSVAVAFGAPAGFKTISLLPEEDFFEEDDSQVQSQHDTEAFDSLSTDKESRKINSPIIRHPGRFENDYDRAKIENDINNWQEEDGTNVWELSGLFEGDIMLNPNGLNRNGLLNESFRWQYGIVPYHIEEDDFTEEELKIIEGALEELRDKTCLEFRPYNNEDKDYIVVQGHESGCWSFVGRQGEGQVLNLMTPGCVKHGVVIHEFVHAVGFYHQQSSYDRDEYILIHWDNIQEGHKHNFKKYDNDTVSNYEVSYDYRSLMHYGPKAFAKDRTKYTITPKEENVEIGQRRGLSTKDIIKLGLMYDEQCSSRKLMHMANGDTWSL